MWNLGRGATFLHPERQTNAYTEPASGQIAIYKCIYPGKISSREEAGEGAGS
jgi:hypothetical protein